ncbi:MAG: hypothetical protein LM580_11450 [Thermofilum sp.]|nr:hypothetical protein [Thermofilum sp.]
MDRLIVYLAVAAAVAAALYGASRLRPQPDYCAEARRLASDVLLVNQTGGRLVGEYYLRGVVVSAQGISCSECGVELRVPTAHNITVVLEGRVRLAVLLQCSSAGCGVAILRKE